MSPSLLTMGGIAAIVATGWSQVKNIFSYISSFILVKATLDDHASPVLTYYLRENWKLMPSGLQLYKSKTLKFRDNEQRTVLWRLPALKAIYYNKRAFLFLSGSMNGMHITYLRGTLNLPKILMEAGVYRDDYSNKATSKLSRNRYWVSDVMGDSAETESKTKRGRGGVSANETEPASGGDSSLSDVHFQSNRDVPLSHALEEFNWSQESDPFESLYYSPEVMKYIGQAKRWANMKEWYDARALQWRRGWLLYGGPGTGKSSLARATAQAINVPIYRFHLSTLTDAEFVREWDNMQSPCVPLLEDFDNVFHGRKNVTKNQLLNFDTVLNCISGVNSKSGIFLIVTTNDITKIDPAMGVTWGEDGVRSGISTRPGRIDTVIHVGNMTIENRRKLALRILADTPEEVDAMVEAGAEVSPVQFEEMCSQRALVLMEEREFAVEQSNKDVVFGLPSGGTVTLRAPEHGMTMAERI